MELKLTGSTFVGGQIPSEFGHLSSLESLDLRKYHYFPLISYIFFNNNIIFSPIIIIVIFFALIILSFFPSFYSINFFNVNRRVFSLFSSLCIVARMWAGGTDVSGPLPSTFNDLRNLTFLDLSGTDLTGDIDVLCGNDDIDRFTTAFYVTCGCCQSV